MKKTQQCTRCGACCRAAPCHTGKLVALYSGLVESIDDIKECPYLKSNEDRTTCTIAHEYAERLAIGAGCQFESLKIKRPGISRAEEGALT